MTGELIKRLAMACRWVGVRLSIARGFAAWCFYLVWPTHGPLYRVGFAVLPYAGDYAYADDPWVKECRAYWVRTGTKMPRPTDEEDAFGRALSKEGGQP